MSRLRFSSLLAVCCLGISTSSLFAVVTFDWTTVGNPGNAANGGWGAVDYTYRISKYEVTNEQYRDFLNAVDASGENPNDVYNSQMGSDVRGGIALNADAPIGSKYFSKTNMGNKPVTYVSFFDSMRLVNWLANDQPTDGSGTESGVYAIDTGLNESRAAGAEFFLPSLNEWWKAAYYDPRVESQGGPPGNDNYWEYPTASDILPTVATADTVGDISNPGTNVANYNYGADWNGQDGNVTTVGTAGAASTSFYGTFDQGGNVMEWVEELEVVGDDRFRVYLGGAWWGDVNGWLPDPPDFERDYYGIRVASIIDILTGDMNGDDEINMEDLSPFALGLTDILAYEAAFPDLADTRVNRGDMNHDGAFNFGDLSPFANVLIAPASSTAIPEPTTWVTCVGFALPLLLLRRSRYSLASPPSS